MSTAPSTELAVLPPALVPASVFAPGGVETILVKLEADVRTAAKDLDISTDKGRKAIASLAYKVARSKTALDDMGKGLVEETKKQVALIDADRRVIRDRLDKLRDEVRKPLDDFEAAEQKRVEQHEAGIADIQSMPLFSGDRTTDDVADRLAKAQAIDTSGFQEFTARAEAAKAAAIATLTAALENSRARDAERAELERLRREAAERAAREEAERIEREKQEAADRAAEQARRDAEEKACQEREEAERAAAAERERIEREAQAERDRAAAEQARAEREKAEAEERAAKAEQDRQEALRRAQEAEEQAERDRIAAEERTRQREEEAAQRERQRIEDERRAEEEAQRRREADRTHRATVNNAAVSALAAAGLSDAAAKAAITAIAKGEVPRVAIAY
ncbi:hypothetical protein [Azospirillum argentinense]|uniref:Uncharacterized protein n=1 Tax=Azospirillum argentinense TaxID=2970906 RepID=A0A5B0KX74_9PROT|nr:hypothetical protein [Azospirillum argentinense]KAA1057192.1 TolA protein [Azospirillum argentinense]